MPLFPKLSFPSVRLPFARSRSERLDSTRAVSPPPLESSQSLPDINSPNTPTTPSDGKSFEKFIDEVSPKFQHDKRFTQGLVKYKNLKSHVKKMENGKFGARPEGEYIDEECAICLEPLGNAADVVNTTCKHRFHTFCLIESLGEGFCSSCPMCRNGVEKIVPNGVEGAQMRLLAKLRINIDQAEATHKAVYDELQKSALHCLNDMEAVNKSKRLTINGHKKKDLERRASQIKDQLQLLEEYDRVNVMGFSKICGKVGRKLSQTLGDTLQSKYVDEKSYSKDFSSPQANSLRRLSQELDKGLEQLRAQHNWTDKIFRRGSMDSSLARGKPKKRPQKRGSMEIVSAEQVSESLDDSGIAGGPDAGDILQSPSA